MGNGNKCMVFNLGEVEEIYVVRSPTKHLFNFNDPERCKLAEDIIFSLENLSYFKQQAIEGDADIIK